MRFKSVSQKKTESGESKKEMTQFEKNLKKANKIFNKISKVNINPEND